MCIIIPKLRDGTLSEVAVVNLECKRLCRENPVFKMFLCSPSITEGSCMYMKGLPVITSNLEAAQPSVT